jgi:hypothetical protein
MSASPSPIYSLLPAVFRMRDAGIGGPLQALFQVLEAQYALVQDNVRQLYDDQFIETCAPWVIPYIGRLIGYSAVFIAALTSPDSRAEVANTIGYRRRKGTLVALEQITHDVSGRATMGVEEFKRLVTNLSLRDVRRHNYATANLRCGAALEDLDGPFTRLNRTISVRNIAPRVRMPVSPDPTPLDIDLHGGGRFNIPDIAVWMWRWSSWRVTNAAAFDLGEGGYFFSAPGGPVPLFQSVPPEPAPFARLIVEDDVPEPISLTRFRTNLPGYYPASMELIADGVPVPLSQITCANLSQPCTVRDGKIAIDPERGRIQYAKTGVTIPKDLRVNYNYGSPAEIGGGPYDRTPNIVQPSSTPNLSFANQANPFLAIVGSPEYPTLESAVADWNDLPPNCAGTIVLPHFERYQVDLTGGNAIQIPAESLLLIASADLTAKGVAEWKNSCATVNGDIEIAAPPPTFDKDGLALPAGQVQISGIWLSGQIFLQGYDACVQVSDSTLIPGIALTSDGDPVYPDKPSITASVTTPPVGMTLVLNRVISGPVTLTPTCFVRICGSIVDAGVPYCPAYSGPDWSSPGASLHIEDSTVVGRVWAQAMPLASNTIFYAKLGRRDPWKAPVWSVQVQSGCVRFCWVPSGSITPRRYQCLPPDAPSEAALEPRFITLRFGLPGYCLLSGDTPVAIWKGADNGSQIGVFYQIQETEAVANIQIRSAEYIPANLERGVFLIPSRALPQPLVPVGYGFVARPPCADGTVEDDMPPGIGLGLI